jgi:capsular polysaccharide transport system permease protein
LFHAFPHNQSTKTARSVPPLFGHQLQYTLYRAGDEPRGKWWGSKAAFDRVSLPGGHTQMVGNCERTIRVWLNVINALLLRDIRARAGKYYTGYLVIFLMPFAHLAVLLAIWTLFMARSPFFGNQPVIFFGVSMLPFVIFVYPSRQVVISLLTNRPLLWFSRVKIIDIFIARGILEFANGMAVAAMVCIVLFVLEGEFSPRDPMGFLAALVLTLYLGFGWGAYNALFAQLFHVWPMAFNLFFPVLWIASGIMFYVHGIPQNYAYLLKFNPLLQCVEYIRYSYYEGYPSNLLDVGYTFWFATCLIACALVFERTFRRQLLSA